MVTAACGDASVAAPEAAVGEAAVSGVATVATAIGTDPRTGATIETDKDDYAPGEVVHLNGRGWAPNETVHLFMTEDPDTHGDVTQDVVADASGAFTLHFYDVQTHDLGVTFTLTATGATSGSKATVVFTDGNVTVRALSVNSGSPITIDVQWQLFANTTCSGTAIAGGTRSGVTTSPQLIANATPVQSLLMSAPASAQGQSFLNWSGGGDHRLTPTICVEGFFHSSSQIWDVFYQQIVGDLPLADAAVGADPNAYSGDEGSAIAISGGGSDPDGGAPVFFSWSAAANTGTTGRCTFAVNTLASTTVTCNDNGSYTLTLRVRDDERTTSLSAATLTVANVAPTATLYAPTSVNPGEAFQIELVSRSDPSIQDVFRLQHYFDCGSGTFLFFGNTTTATCTAGSSGPITVKGKIKDKDGGETTYEKLVAVNNLLPPTASAGGPYSGNEASAINISGSGSDPDGGAAVTFLWTATANSPAVGSCTFATATSASTTVTCTDNGTYTLTLTVTDDENTFTTSTATLTVANVAPATPTITAPSSVNESGTPFNFSASSNDVSSVDVAAGLTFAFSCDDGATFGAFSTSSSGQCAAPDGPETVKIAVKAMDKDGGVSGVAKQSVTVNNVAPTLNAIGSTVALAAVGTPVNITLDFSDPAGTNDTYQAVVNWDDGSGFVTETNDISSVATVPHTFTAAGVYRVCAKVADEDSGLSNELCYEYLVVYDPSAGFVTGGGWIDSPAGAYRANTSLTGKATFGFVSRYLRGANVPTGNTEFQFRAGGLNFSSTSYQWLVVSGDRAQYKGSGTVNGVSGYSFLISVKDGSPDTFRIKITDANGVVYDNHFGTDENAEPTTALGGGSIVIHTKP